MLLRRKHFELEIANFVFIRIRLLGCLYIGPDVGFGSWVRISPKEIDGFRLKYVDRARRNFRRIARRKRNRS